MSSSVVRHISKPKLLVAALAACAIASTVAVGTGFAAGHHTKRVVAEAQSEALGKTVLTTTGGRTLYSLSLEKHGRFICTASCLAEWHPLTVPAGTHPTGPVKLGTIERTDNGKTQVTYRGRPLYRFAEDRKAGDANGEGIKDVGTWHAATDPQAGSTAPPSGGESPNPYPPSESPPAQNPPSGEPSPGHEYPYP
jgi:predicted lipoprotein with Yx(FWY)xxD motif